MVDSPAETAGLLKNPVENGSQNNQGPKAL